MIEQSFTTGTVVPRWVRTVEPLSSTAHRQEPKTIETIVLPLGSTAFPSRLRVRLDEAAGRSFCS